MNFVTMQTQSDIGISAAEFNLAMQHDSQRSPDTSFRLPHYTGQNIEEHAKVKKHWLCHQGFPDGSGHWWVVSFRSIRKRTPPRCPSPRVRSLIKERRLGDALQEVRQYLRGFDSPVCQHDVHLPVDGPYALRGKGPRAQGPACCTGQGLHDIKEHLRAMWL